MDENHQRERLSTLMKESSVSEKRNNHQAKTVLVGAGVVGRAIARCHLEAGIPFVLIDQDASQLRSAVHELKSVNHPFESLEIMDEDAVVHDTGRSCLGENKTQLAENQRDKTQEIGSIDGVSLQLKHRLDGSGLIRSSVAGDQVGVADFKKLGAWAEFSSPEPNACNFDSTIVIESISESLDVKRAFFRQSQRLFGGQAVYCSNTSNLQIQQIADGLDYPERVCGMHFFMPVHERQAVEIASGISSDRETIYRAVSQVMRLKKQPIQVEDAPGFIVNRLLAPYLNESLLLLCRGVSPRVIERAAKRYGMPLSPLELIDWIGTRTAFDSGRVFWRAFPKRLCPAPLLPALVKNDRGGRFSGGGIYDYTNGRRSMDVSSKVSHLVKRYQTSIQQLDEQQVLMLLAVPMWIEAVLARLDGVIRSTSELDLAMRGGLGFDAKQSWSGFFDRIGSTAIAQAIQQWSSLTPSMDAPSFVVNRLRAMSPSEVIDLGRQRPAHVA